MAQNIAPSMACRENEVQGLVAWSVIPIRVVAMASLLTGAGQLFFLLVSVSLAQATVVTVARCLEGMNYFVIGAELLLLLRYAKKYVDVEDDTALIRAMTFLSRFWILYVSLVVLSAVPLLLQLTRKGLGFTFVSSPLWWGLVPAVAVPLFVVVFRIGLSSEAKKFTDEIQPFARINLPWIRTIALATLASGVMFMYLFATNRVIPGGGAFPFVRALSSMAIGTSLVFVWKAVREIHRNSTLIYFERTLEKMNFFWLIFCIVLLIQIAYRL